MHKRGLKQQLQATKTTACGIIKITKSEAIVTKMLLKWLPLSPTLWVIINQEKEQLYRRLALRERDLQAPPQSRESALGRFAMETTRSNAHLTTALAKSAKNASWRTTMPVKHASGMRLSEGAQIDCNVVAKCGLESYTFDWLLFYWIERILEL